MFWSKDLLQLLQKESCMCLKMEQKMDDDFCLQDCWILADLLHLLTMP